MFNTSKDIIIAENKIVGHSTSPDEIARARHSNGMIASAVASDWPRTMSLRQCGKKSNHGLNYDEGYKNFALINSIEEREAKRVVEMYHSIYPGIRVMYDAIKRKLQKDRFLVNCFGRKVFFMDDWCQDMWKSAYSMLPQSTVVDSVNMGMVHIYHDTFLTKECNINLLAQVHDSLLLEVPRKVAAQKELWEIILNKIYTYMSPTLSYNGRDFKIKNDLKMGLNWGEMGSNNPAGMRDISSHEELMTNFFAG
jgi:DNA polymerase I-like protein with 3'-5' exonuclease and polymerase domains